MNNFFISVVICTYNPKIGTLIRVLNSLLSQDLSSDFWELIVVDNNSDIPVADDPFIVHNNIRVVFEGKQGLSHARLAGLNSSKGSLLVYVDDDNILSYNYLSLVNDAFKNDLIGIIGPSIKAEYIKIPEKWFYSFEGMLAINNFKQSRNYFTNIPRYCEYFPAGAGLCIRREIITSYYSNISDLDYLPGRKGNSLSSGEDIDLDFYCLSKGYLIGIISNLELVHVIPSERVDVNYLCKLAQSSLHSSFLLNNKWKPYFGHNVIPIFDQKIILILFKFILFLFLIWHKKFRIKFFIYKYLLFLRLL